MSRHQHHLTFFPHAAPKGQNMKVNGTKTLLVSAYQEHRGGHKEVSDRGTFTPSVEVCLEIGKNTSM